MSWMKEVYCRIVSAKCLSDATELAFERYDGPKVEYRPPFQWGKKESWVVSWLNMTIPDTLLNNLKKAGFLVAENILWIEHGKEGHKNVEAFCAFIESCECVFLKHSAFVTLCPPKLTFPINRPDIGEKLAANFHPADHICKYE